jgi:hypothetical protein
VVGCNACSPDEHLADRAGTDRPQLFVGDQKCVSPSFKYASWQSFGSVVYRILR